LEYPLTETDIIYKKEMKWKQKNKQLERK